MTANTDDRLLTTDVTAALRFGFVTTLNDAVRVLGECAWNKTSMQWIRDSLADRPVHIDQIGVMYMFSRAWVPDLHGTSHSTDHTYQVGPT